MRANDMHVKVLFDFFWLQGRTTHKLINLFFIFETSPVRP